MPVSKRLKTFLWAAALLASALAATKADAHAIILQSTPALNAVVDGKDVQVMLRFNSRIDQTRSKLSLVGPDQAPVTLPLAPETQPDTIKAEAADLAAGGYRLRWQVLSIDGHITRGDITFSVKP